MKELRKLVGLSQKEIAGELDLDTQTIHRLEKGDHKIKQSVEDEFLDLVNDDNRLNKIKAKRKKEMKKNES